MSTAASRERRQRDDQLGAVPAPRARPRGSAASSAGSTLQQQQRLQRLRQHLAGVQAAGAGQRADELGADAVGRFAEVADAGAGLLADPVARAPAACAACGCCAAALPSSTALRSPDSSESAISLGCVAALRLRRRGDALGCAPPRRRRRPARATQRARRGGDAGRPPASPSRRAPHAGSCTCAPLAHGLAEALREQRMVLAQERADDERALERRTARRSAVPSQRARRRRVGWRSRRGAGGGRCSRCPGRAPAWPAGAVPRRVPCAEPSAPMRVGAVLGLDAACRPSAT